MRTPAILVATWDDGLFVINGDARSQEMAGLSVPWLAPDGYGGALAIVGGHSLRRRTPDGRWTTLATSEFDLSCCMAVRDAIYVGTNDACMLQLNHGGTLELLDGFANVAGRETWFAGSAIVNGQRLGPPLGIRTVAANANGSILFANVHVGGIPRSLDGGMTWQPTLDIQADVHEVCVHPADPNLIAAAAAVGLCISRDGGATWTTESDGLHAPHCSAVAFVGDDILVSAATDPFTLEGRVYRRAAGSGDVLVAVEGMPVWTEGIVHSGCIAANGRFVAMADPGGSLYWSEDFGRTWARKSIGLPMPSCVLIC